LGRDEYASKLKPLLEEALATGKSQKVEKYLSVNSHLPGPRGNLELAEEFAKALEPKAMIREEASWALSLRLARLAGPEAASNTPGEFVAFCGVRGVGVLGGVSRNNLEKAAKLLKDFSKDGRWRVREAVAMSIQWLLKKDPDRILRELSKWIRDGEWLQMRAVAAGVAEPPLLKNPRIATSAFGLHREIFDLVMKNKNRESEQFRALRQTLGYSLSVVGVAKPEETFSYMKELVKANDRDVLWVIRENLKKSRLLKNFPTEVRAVGKLVA
jgi:hypothetical protein